MTTTQEPARAFATEKTAFTIPERLSRAAWLVAAMIGSVFGRRNRKCNGRWRPERVQDGSAKERSVSMRLDVIATRRKGSES